MACDARAKRRLGEVGAALVALDHCEIAFRARIIGFERQSAPIRSLGIAEAVCVVQRGAQIVPRFRVIRIERDRTLQRGDRCLAVAGID